MKNSAFVALAMMAILVVLFLLDGSAGAQTKTLVAASFFGVAAIVLALMQRPSSK